MTLAGPEDSFSPQEIRKLVTKKRPMNLKNWLLNIFAPVIKFGELIPLTQLVIRTSDNGCEKKRDRPIFKFYRLTNAW